MPTPLDLSNIGLPEEDANKPAEIKKEEETTELPNENAETTETSETTDTTKETETEEKKEETTETKKDDAVAEDKDKDKDEDKDKDKNLTPFHKHPDWIKMQEENKTLTANLNQLKGQIEILTKTNKPTVEEKKEIQKTAEERIQEDIANGWKPTSQVEVIARGLKYIREELQASQKSQEQKKVDDAAKVEETKKQIIKQIDDTFAELATSDPLLKDEKVQEKVLNQVNEWRAAGMAGISVQTIKVAYDYLKSKNQLGTVAAPVTEKRDEKKTEVNRKISKPGGGGSGTKENKFVIKNAAIKSLDQITEELGGILDKT